MAITRADGPSDGLAALRKSLPHLLSRSSSQLGGAAEIKVTEPIPLYTVPAREIDGPNFLAKISRTAWRYIILGNEALALADVKEKPDSHRSNLETLVQGPI